MFYRERPAPVLIAGVIVATLGAVITGTQTQDAGDASVFGNFLALCGAISVAGYLLLGRQLRSRVDTLSYVTTVYSTAAVLLVILTLLTGDPFTGYSNQTYLLLFLIALVPQVIGHTSFNWSLKHFSAATIAVITLGEPVGASMLAYMLLDEYITLIQLCGGLLILAGVGVTLLGDTSTVK
jgi:drug/metabolite transporter (DMT)-like permease